MCVTYVCRVQQGCRWGLCNGWSHRGRKGQLWSLSGFVEDTSHTTHHLPLAYRNPLHTLHGKERVGERRGEERRGEREKESAKGRERKKGREGEREIQDVQTSNSI